MTYPDDRSRVPWTAAFPEAFRRTKHYDLLDRLPEFFGQEGGGGSGSIRLLGCCDVALRERLLQAHRPLVREARHPADGPCPRRGASAFPVPLRGEHLQPPKAPGHAGHGPPQPAHRQRLTAGHGAETRRVRRAARGPRAHHDGDVRRERVAALTARDEVDGGLADGERHQLHHASRLLLFHRGTPQEGLAAFGVLPGPLLALLQALRRLHRAGDGHDYRRRARGEDRRVLSDVVGVGGLCPGRYGASGRPGDGRYLRPTRRDAVGASSRLRYPRRGELRQGEGAGRAIPREGAGVRGPRRA